MAEDKKKSRTRKIGRKSFYNKLEKNLKQQLYLFVECIMYNRIQLTITINWYDFRTAKFEMIIRYRKSISMVSMIWVF